MGLTGFIKSLGLGAAGLILPPNAFLHTRPFNIYDNYLRGWQHYSFSKVKSNIREGDDVILIRD